MSEMTDDELYTREVTRQVDNVARKLEVLASRLRDMNAGFSRADRRHGAVSLSADIVNEFTQGVGNTGTYLWGVVDNAGRLDQLRLNNREA